MAAQKISPVDLVHLEQYKKYAADLGYNRDKLNWKYSSINKYPVESLVAYDNLSVFNTITVLYKITNFDPDLVIDPVIYNTVFLSTDIEKSELFIDYICPSGSMISKNGEYRNGILNWQKFKEFLKKHTQVKKLFESIVDFILNVFVERKNNFSTEVFYPNNTIYKNKKQIEQECKNNMIYFYAITWIKFYYNYASDIIPNNLNNDFKQIMLKYASEDKLSFIKLMSEYKAESEILVYICTNSISSNVNLYQNKKLGQKMIILTLAEYDNFYNFEYNTWSELSINSKVSDLVLNKVTNGFSLLNNWLLIKATNVADLFDNPQHYNRIEKSNIALQVVKILTDANKHTKTFKLQVKFNKNLDNIVKNVTDSFDSNNSPEIDELNVLQNNINYSINYAKENIILSNVVLSMISEYSGQTFYDTTLFVKNMFSKENFENFEKYIFQLLYNLYCLNTKVHCIHGDLHLNNITISPMFNKKITVDKLDPKIIYIIDKPYVFTNNFYNLCIIDFNSSSTNIDLYDMDSTSTSNNTFKQKNISKDALLTAQIKKILPYLYSIKPEYKQYENIIINNMTYHYAEYFKILSVLDISNATSKILTYMRNGKKIGTVSESSIKLITDINKLSNYYLTTVFEKLLNTKNYTEFQNMEWPGLAIIKEVFSYKNTEINKDTNITDIYNYNNSGEFSLTLYNSFPKYLKDASLSQIKQRKIHEAANKIKM